MARRRSKRTGDARAPRLEPKRVQQILDPDDLQQIINQCIALIDPLQENRVLCREKIWRYLKDLNLITPGPDYFFSPGYLAADRRKLKKLAKALGTAATILKDLRYWQRLFWPDERQQDPKQSPIIAVGTDYPTVCNMLLALHGLASEAARSLHVEKGHPSINGTKLFAAAYAFHLLSGFGSKPPTQSVGGPYYELASTLYEGVTRISGADLSRQCKSVFRNIRASQKGRT